MNTVVNVSAHLFYRNRFGTGIMVRTAQEAVNFNIKINLNDNFRIGYSYGVVYGTLKSAKRGSHEISVNYSKPMWQQSERTTNLLWL